MRRVLAAGAIAMVEFGFSASLHGDGRAIGSFHHQGILEGLDIDFKGTVAIEADLLMIG